MNLSRCARDITTSTWSSKLLLNYEFHQGKLLIRPNDASNGDLWCVVLLSPFFCCFFSGLSPNGEKCIAENQALPHRSYSTNLLWLVWQRWIFVTKIPVIVHVRGFFKPRCWNYWLYWSLWLWLCCKSPDSCRWRDRACSYADEPHPSV
jgi:hypothetical protein